MHPPTADEWRVLLDELEAPSAGDLAGVLADARDVPVSDAYDAVEAAVDEGVLAERETGGAFPTVALASDEGAPGADGTAEDSNDGADAEACTGTDDGEGVRGERGRSEHTHGPESEHITKSNRNAAPDTPGNVSDSVSRETNTPEGDGAADDDAPNGGPSMTDNNSNPAAGSHEGHDTAAFAAFRDVIEFYHRRVDDTIVDHTEDGEHAERPTTAREYFTEGRGWSDGTVDELRLGWAPPRHTDELVAFLHERGHSRAAMLATGLIGESDGGGFYTTWAGRYVLPYYDSEGEPAYAIARCTGGIGGGAAGYGGHPADYQAGKYAKVRHSDPRVPVEEPIYGLDTLAGADHVFIAEGIADAITARSEGYAVLSPVAKEFKKDHYEPLGEVLEAHDIDRVTIVADADNADLDTDDEGEPGDIGTAVGRTLATVAPGLAGALRTAAGLGQEAADVDIRVAEPPAPGLTTSDLDEFVTEWDGNLEALARSGRPAEEYAEFEDAQANTGGGAGTNRGGSFDGEIEVDMGEAPDDLPQCYEAALEARTAPGATKVNSNHDLNLLVASLAVYAGYDDDEIVAQFGEYPPNGDEGQYDASITRRAIEGTRAKVDNEELAPPGEEKLRRVGILNGNCDCHIHSDGEYDDDPREANVVLEPQRAWDAAGRVVPDDLDEDLGAETDGDGWRVGGETVDVVRAVAVLDLGHDVSEPLDSDTYDRAYSRARNEYGAPLPRYMTTTDAAESYAVARDAYTELDAFDLDLAALDIPVREADEGGDVAHYLDLREDGVGWRDSDSGESVLLFDSGTVYDCDIEATIDPLRLVALDAGLIDDPTADVETKQAYRLARDEYDAPLPRWALGKPEVEPVLPPADELVEGVETTDDDLQGARDDVEALYRGLARGEGEAPVSVLRALPSLGKTTAAIKSAADIPTTYLAPRKELQEDARGKAEEWGASSAYLPVFGGSDVNDEAVGEAVAAVRSEGLDLLRDRPALLEAVDEPLYEDDEGEADEEEVDLQRATCSCADGEHGEGWTLAVHAARELDYTPRDIHERSEALFGRLLPCQWQSGHVECEYTAGWDAVTDPDDPTDLLIGSYVHAHVEGARTYYERDADDSVRKSPRAVVFDEYPGDEFTEEFGDEFVDHAVWLAGSLRADIEDRQDLFRADLWDDEAVRAWLRGDHDTSALDALGGLATVAEAVATAEDVLDNYEAFVENNDLREPLTALVDAAGDLDAETAADLAEAVGGRVSGISGQGAGLARRLGDDVVEALEDGRPVADPLAQLPDYVGGDLRAFVEDAVEAAVEGRDRAAELLRAARTALEGGDRGCRELAVHAEDGYAHREAHRLLEGVIAPDGEDGVADVIETSAFVYGGDRDDEGGRLRHVAIDGGEDTDTVLVDRDHQGATVLSPPDRTAGGEEAPFVGLDATARRRLWGVTFGCEVALEDIHDTQLERARFLRDTLGLQVVRTADRPRFYEGDPRGKDLDSDVALVEEIDDEYTGVHAGGRDEDAATVGSPAVITTKSVRNVLEDDDRLDGRVSEWDNYGNITGDNDLGDHRLAAVLGCQHYGDAAIEKTAALAGEEVTRSGHGEALSYDSPIANAYLQHMTADQTMQAVLRFARGDTGAVVFARTAALRDDLPVVGEGRVVRSWSETAATVARAWKRQRGEFTVADVADSVDVTRRQVRRVLDEFVGAGHLEKHETGDGLANQFTPSEDPSAGQVELPSVGLDPDTSRKGTYYTRNVRVWDLASGARPGPRATESTLPAPQAAAEGDPPT